MTIATEAKDFFQRHHLSPAGVIGAAAGGVVVGTLADAAIGWGERAFAGEIQRFPFSQTAKEVVHIGAPLNKDVATLKPEMLEDTYGISIAYLKPAGDWQYLEDDPRPNARLYIRPNEAAFRQVFGFLYEGNDPYIERKVLIRVVQKDALCSSFSPDFSPFQHLYDTTTAKLRTFIETLRKEKFQLPKITTSRGNIIYDIGGNLSLDENLARLHGYYARYSAIQLTQYLLQNCFSPGENIGYGGVVTPAFVGDQQGKIIFGPDGRRPKIALEGHVYVSTNPLSLTSGSQSGMDNGEFPSFGETLVHEVSHIKHNIVPPPENPADFLSEEADHDVIREEARTYINSAFRKLQRGDDSGYLFVVQTPDTNIIALRDETKTAITALMNPLPLMAGILAFKAAEKLEGGDPGSRREFLHQTALATGLALTADPLLSFLPNPPPASANDFY